MEVIEEPSQLLYYVEVLGPLFAAFVLGMVIGYVVGSSRGLLRGIKIARGEPVD